MVTAATQARRQRFSFTCVLKGLVSVAQELMVVVPLVEVQSSRTQRPTSGTSYPYVDLTLGDMNTQRVIQLQLEQVSSKLQRNSHTFVLLSWFYPLCVHRVWSCVESLPCMWKTWCLCGKKGSLFHPAKSPCCNNCRCFSGNVDETFGINRPLLTFRWLWGQTSIYSNIVSEKSGAQKRWKLMFSLIFFRVWQLYLLLYF